jgi:hypothetical protein
VTAFRATYSDWKLVKTRQVVQVVFEIPIEDSDKAYEVLGGMPNFGTEQWFGIAAISAEAAQPRQVSTSTPAGKRDWRELQPQQQAGIRCAEPTFAAFLKETKPDDWHESQDATECVRLICGVRSRVELGIDHRARVLWHTLDQEYQGWLAKERIGA